MPEDYELYYGFTRFAMELNELDLETAKILPTTDTRFRPDQRYLLKIYLMLHNTFYSFMFSNNQMLYIYFYKNISID